MALCNDGLPPGAVAEEDRPLVEGLPLKAATLPALARLLAQAFGDDGEPRGSFRGLPRAVLLVHQWFAPSAALAELLAGLHSAAAHQEPCVAEDCAHRAPHCPQQRLRQQVGHAFRYWLRTFPMHFDMDRALAAVLRRFQSTLPPEEAERLDLSQVPSYEWMRHVSVRAGGGGGGGGCSGGGATDAGGNDGARKTSLVFNNLQPLQLAQHLTFLEHKVLRRIAITDVQQYVRSGSLAQAPKLERSVSLCNGLTQWVQCMVLSRTTPAQRALVMDKFIAVAQKLLELQNYNSLMAVVGSVSHSSLARLSRTTACLPPDSRRALADLSDLLSSAGNFAHYRRALHAATGFRIPIVGIHLKDLVAVNAALPDRLEGDMVNVRKLAQLAVAFEELDTLRQANPPFDVNMDLANTLRLSLDLAYTEEEIYELSLAREPRNATSPQSSPTQSVLFAEWAAGPCTPPDPATIEKHVTAMVEAVFKNYDNDRDGYISHEEFEAVAGNFPFIASFCVLDADHDGMISQEEMKKYFIHANCHALKSGFKHDFHETTYFKPTFCAHCAGLLWGLIRQGYKCRDCGINAHKHCKELVVMECRARPPQAGEGGPSHAASSRRRFRRKPKKGSQSEPESSPPSPKLPSSAASVAGGDSEQSDGGGGSGGGSLPPSPKPASLWAGPRRKISDSLLMPHGRVSARLRPQQSCPESVSAGRSRPPLAHQSAVLQLPSGAAAVAGAAAGAAAAGAAAAHPVQLGSSPESSSGGWGSRQASPSASPARPPPSPHAHDVSSQPLRPAAHHSSFPHLTPSYHECFSQMSAVHKAISQLFQSAGHAAGVAGRPKCASHGSLAAPPVGRGARPGAEACCSARLGGEGCSSRLGAEGCSSRPGGECSSSRLGAEGCSSRPGGESSSSRPGCGAPPHRHASDLALRNARSRCASSAQGSSSACRVFFPPDPPSAAPGPCRPAREDPPSSPTSPPPTAQALQHTCKELEEARRKLQAAEEARQRLERENCYLLHQLEAAYRELDSLREHVGEVQQHTVAFILSQMETLHLQKDTHV